MSGIFWLDPDSTEFPPISLAVSEPNGLLAAGGDLSPARLINAYRHGIFPWFDDDQPILWWSPNPRCVLFPEHLHVSRSLAKRLRKGGYEVCFDRCFSEVVQICAAPRATQSGTWITDDMLAAYEQLHALGVAHSVEVWRDGQLVGGLYGLVMGRLFFGESMFSRESDASKIAFVHLVEQLRIWGYYLIDCQVYSEHLASLGASEIPRSDFQRILNREVDVKMCHPWQMQWQYPGLQHD